MIEDAWFSSLAKGTVVSATQEEIEAIELRVLIEIHEFARNPWVEKRDVLGYLTQRKRKIRRNNATRKRSGAGQMRVTGGAVRTYFNSNQDPRSL